MHEADSTSQMPIDPSSDVTISQSRLIYAKDITWFCASNFFLDTLAMFLDQIWTIQLSSPDAKCRPSIEKVTHQTLLECPVYTMICNPVVASHNLTVLSNEPEAMNIPLGEYASERTGPLWPVMTSRRAPVCIFHRWMV